MRRTLAPLLALALLGCDGCEDGERTDPVAEPVPAPAPAPIAAPRPVATPAAFDLVAVEGGAALVWGPPANDGGGVQVGRLDPLGGVRGEPVVIYSRPPSEVTPVPPDAVEIAAAAGGGRMVIGFVARLQPELHAFATHGPDGAEAFAPPEDLATLRVESVGRRGTIASASGPDGRGAVLYREMPAPCPAGTDGEGCVQFGIRRLGGSTGRSGRQGIGLSVPTPCEGAVAGYLWSGGVWYYGLCARPGGHPVTTVYAIQPDPEYAHAESALEGCEPLGLVPADEGAVLVGRCPGGVLGAVAFAEAGQRRLELPRVERTIACAEGRPLLAMNAGERTVRLALRGPRSQLGPWLPEDLGPRGARAVWTGDALLVAHPLARDVSLRRYQCVDGELTRTDNP